MLYKNVVGFNSSEFVGVIEIWYFFVDLDCFLMDCEWNVFIICIIGKILFKYLNCFVGKILILEKFLGGLD